jgi:YidC/Oxa1 family membrane protein insertase
MEGSKRNLLLPLILLVALGGYYAASSFLAPEPGPDGAQGAGDQTAEDPTSQARRAGPQRSPSPASNLAERRRQRRTGTIRGEQYEATVDNVGGGITHFRLTGDPRFMLEGEPIDVITTEREEFESMRVQLSSLGVPDDAVWELEQRSEREVRLRWEGGGVEVERSLRAGAGPYQVLQTVRVRNTTQRARRAQLAASVFHYVHRRAESGGFLGLGARSPEISHGLCVYGDETVRKDRAALAPEDEAPVPHGYGAGDTHLAAVENSYFAQALAADGAAAQRCGISASNRGNPVDGTLFEAKLVFPSVTLEPNRELSWRMLGYLGPKEPAALAAAGHHLPEMVDLGFFALIAAQLAKLLGFIHQFVPNWGIAIILLTVLIRLVLFPLTNMSFRSMARMRQLKPEMDRLNELYAANPEQKGAAVMELYRKHKINPLSGCLPMLLQLPVWWALYTSLSTNIELYHMPFALWWSDLSAPDPYFVLPLALGALMHVQQRMTPTTADPVQAKMMMWFMPIMITAFMLFLPAGLCLYMLTNSALGIGQQKLNEYRLGSQAPVQSAEAAEGSADDGADGDGEDDDPSNEPRRAVKRKRVRRARRG